MKAFSSFCRSSSISWSYRPNSGRRSIQGRVQQIRRRRLLRSIILVNFILQNSQHALKVHFYRLFGMFHVVWAHSSSSEESPIYSSSQFCTRSVSVGIGKLRSAEGQQRTVSEHQWAERNKNGTWTVWGRLGNVGRALAPLCDCLRFQSYPPPPQRPLTTIHCLERPQNAQRAFHQERWRTLQILYMSKTPCDTMPFPTTYNGHLAPLLRPPTLVCVLPPFHER